MDTSKKIYSAAIAAVLVALVSYGVYSIVKKDAPEPTQNTTPKPTATITGNRLVAEDQFPGSVVYISSVTLENGGWVVVHEEENGKAGKIIGSTYFAKGTNPGNVELSSNTVEGKNYYVMLHGDDGDRVFDDTKDAPLKDAAGVMIMTKIQATTKFVEQKG